MATHPLSPCRLSLDPRASRAIAATIVATVVLGLSPASCPAGSVVLNPKATYLRLASSDNLALPAIPFDLAALGIAPGDRISIAVLGDFDNGPQGDTFNSSLAIFSASAVLLAPNQLVRVPDALEAGVDVVSAPAFFDGLPTDVPQDFIVSSADHPSAAICVIVPPGATHLFVAVHDSYYEDNSDPDGDLAVEIGLLDPCASDVDASGVTDGGDLGLLLAGWGPSAAIGAVGDLDCDGDVDGADLGLLLAGWGACP